MSEPRVSVVIPAFNSEAFIVETLQSVMAQSFRDYEILVVDDGSADETKQVVRRTHPEARVLRQENRGVAEARSRGVREARGEYVAFIDSDDLWHEENLALKVNALDQHTDLGMVFSNFLIFDRTGVRYESGLSHMYPFFRRTGKRLCDVFSRRDEVSMGGGLSAPLLHGNIFDDLFQGNFILSTTTVLRRDAMLEAGLFRSELRTQEDWDFFLRLSRRHPVGYIDAVLARYRRHREQLTDSSNIDGVLENVLTVIDGYRADFEERGMRRLFRRRRADTLQALAKSRIRAGEGKSARRLAVECVCMHPLRLENYFTVVMSCVPTVLSRAVLGARKARPR